MACFGDQNFKTLQKLNNMLSFHTEFDHVSKRITLAKLNQVTYRYSQIMLLNCKSILAVRKQKYTNMYMQRNYLAYSCKQI